jgi:hypothetical protein
MMAVPSKWMKYLSCVQYYNFLSYLYVTRMS